MNHAKIISRLNAIAQRSYGPRRKHTIPRNSRMWWHLYSLYFFRTLEWKLLPRPPIRRVYQLRGIHGDGNCHICGKPKVAEGSINCSYPHAMLPDQEISPGMWSWRGHGELTQMFKPGDRVE